MSGGSFDYLCAKEPSSLFDDIGTVQEMANFLAKLGYADDAARETQELVFKLRQSINFVGVCKRRLDGVFKAAEWWCSGDHSEIDFKRELSKYRGEA